MGKVTADLGVTAIGKQFEENGAFDFQYRLQLVEARTVEELEHNFQCGVLLALCRSDAVTEIGARCAAAILGGHGATKLLLEGGVIPGRQYRFR